jgi:TFIIF-interacting CTD phosphatase-like protein
VKEGVFVKDLTRLGMDLSQTIIIDNSPVAYSHNKSASSSVCLFFSFILRGDRSSHAYFAVNAIPIDSWFGGDRYDRALLDLLPFLNALRYAHDVRNVLSLRTKI